MTRGLAFLATAVLAGSQTAHATPSTTFWAPSTTYVQPFGVLHVTYDTYFRARAAYPIDVGLTIGVLPWKGIQAEVGFDIFYPLLNDGEPEDMSLVLNAKVGAPEDVYFPWQPSWSFGIYGVGLKDVTEQNILYLMLGKTLPYVGSLNIGGYFGLNEDLFPTGQGDTERAGLLAGWTSPAIDVPIIDKIYFTWDIQTGNNAVGATGGGVYFYFTPAIALLTGPVFFFEPEVQPGASSFMWSLQLDIDIDFATQPKE